MKTFMKRAVAGLLMVPIVALGISFVTTSAPAFAADATTQIQAGLSKSGVDNTTNLTTTVGNIIQVLLLVIGLLSVIMLIVGGIRYVISAGNATQVTAAKSTIMYALIGLVVAILATVIVRFVINALSGTANI